MGKILLLIALFCSQMPKDEVADCHKEMNQCMDNLKMRGETLLSTYRWCEDNYHE